MTLTRELGERKTPTRTLMTNSSLVKETDAENDLSTMRRIISRFFEQEKEEGENTIPGIGRSIRSRCWR